jgi:DegV family protein with EDD domain
MLGDKEYEDGININPDDIFKWSDENKTTPKTSAPSMESVIKTMKPLLEQGHELICFAISEDMSTSANVMRLSADELGASDRVHVIDSMNLSTGIGHLVIEAAIMANSGKSVDDILKQIEKLRPLVRASFVVDTLTYLYRGGRCSGLSAMVGSALKLHPMITVVDGKMIPGKKYRGNLSKVILSYSNDLTEAMHHARKDRVFITHSGCDRETVDAVRNYLENLNIFKEVLETRAGGVVSSHCGPGTLGVLFISEQ